MREAAGTYYGGVVRHARPRARMMRAPVVSCLLCVFFLCLAGCSEKADEKPPAPAAPARASARRSVSSTNRVSLAELFPFATTNELAHMKACQDSIDAGHDAFAVRHARELMDSTNAEIRLQAVGAFGWIGKVAIRELAEMMADPDEEVASEAQRQWEIAFDEFSSDVSKMREIERAAGLVKDQSQIEAVMMKLAELEDHNSVKVLSSIITSTNSTPVATEVAREEYASLVGEPFLDASRAEQLAKQLKDRADGIVPEPPKGEVSATNQAGPRVQRDQGKEMK